jgi:hypothetical protein
MLHIQKHHDNKSLGKEKKIVLTIVYNFGFVIKTMMGFLYILLLLEHWLVLIITPHRLGMVNALAFNFVSIMQT